MHATRTTNNNDKSQKVHSDCVTASMTSTNSTDNRTDSVPTKLTDSDKIKMIKNR